MTKFVITETKIYEVNAEDKEDAMLKFDMSDDGEYPLVDMEITVDAV